MNRIHSNATRTVRLICASSMLLGLLVTGCTVGHQVTLVKKGEKVQGQAAYYALPRTVVIVDFPVQMKVHKAGTGTDFHGATCESKLDDEIVLGNEEHTLRSAIGLRLDHPKPGTTSYAVTGSPVIKSLAEPDPAAIYRVDLTSSWSKKQMVDLTFGPLGVLEAGTSSVQDKRVDLAVATVKAVVDITTAFKIAPEGAPPETKPDAVNCLKRTDPCHKAACEIYKARMALATLPDEVGFSGLDGEQAEWLEKRHERTIEQNTPLFVRTVTNTTTISCAVRPMPGDPSDIPILKFDKLKGFSAGGDRADCKIPAEFEGDGCDLYLMTVTVPGDQYSETLRTAHVDNHDTSAPQGFYYRIPTVASIEIRKGKERVTEQDLVVAQLGLVAALPAQRTYQTKYVVALDPATGALTKLTADSEAVDSAAITGVGDAVSGYLEKREEEDAAEKAAKDELALLERERKILEEKDKIRGFKEKLGIDDEP